MYYQDKKDSLKRVFGASTVLVKDGFISVDGKRYPVLDDVIILSGPERQSAYVRSKLDTGRAEGKPDNFAEDIQFTFGHEWETFNRVLDEHRSEFDKYFDIVDLPGLKGKTAADLGCGNGRWSFFLADKCKEIALIDFSDAIFVARKNLASKNNALFFMCDITKLPFTENFCDLAFSLGVLHHLPVDCLAEVRNLKRFSRELLVFLYYALDNRPVYFRAILRAVTFTRKIFSKVTNEPLRKCIAKIGAFTVYLPLVYLGNALNLFGLGKYVPLYEFYHDRTVKRIEQDVYDRFFTSIEQRVTKKQILGLKDSFSKIIVSDNLPYWHFLCIK